MCAAQPRAQSAEGESFRLDTLGRVSSRGGWLSYARSMSHVRRMVPSWCCVVGPRGIKSPYLVSNLATAEEAWGWYQKRFRIETFSQTRKAEGSYSEVTHIRPPASLSVINRRMFSIYLDCLLGALGEEGWRERIHRKKLVI